MTAPQSDGLGRVQARCNFVAQDEIWKAHVHHEENASKRWDNVWHFLKTSKEELLKDELKTLRKERPPREIPTPLKLPPITPTHEYIEVLPSPRPFPRTTAQQIGWRSSQRDLLLDRYGGYARGKGGLIKQLKWPAEAVG
ncbi:ciliary microtubule inner protein 1-like [Tubulanus polymorphus]|uniref:ciliary microtubule inner protein 1-like n=1 Tax=Tubulanus polymorphus TaxID=672921 RepID=UPI003DA6C2A4